MLGMRLEFLRDVEYNQKLEAQGLVDRGITDELLYFWFNLRNGNYVSKDLAVVDGERLKVKCDGFKEDINKWLYGSIV